MSKPPQASQAADTAQRHTSAQLGAVRPLAAPEERLGTKSAEGFEPERRAASGRLRACLDALTQRLLSLETRQRARKAADLEKFGLTVEAIACNLIALKLFRHGLPLKIALSSGALWNGKSRYASPVFGEHLRVALELMASSKPALVSLSKG